MCVFYFILFRAGLELNYPDVDVLSCITIPQKFREKISKEWGPPQVRLATANTVRQDTQSEVTDTFYMFWFVEPVRHSQALKETFDLYNICLY